MNTDPRIDSYIWAGGREAMLRFGPDDGPIVVLALPLFEEANRTRAFGIGILRALAARGIGGVLSDLPGQGESETTTDAMRLVDLSAALDAVPATHMVAIRSGALLSGLRPCWMLAPQSADELMREIGRQMSAQEKAEHADYGQLRRGGSAGPIPGRVDGALRVAGNLIHDHFMDELGQATLPGDGRGPVAKVAATTDRTSAPSAPNLDPGFRRGGPIRRVRLTNDPRPADRHLDGPALWRRAEPDNDPAFAQTLAADIADWIATCEG